MTPVRAQHPDASDKHGRLEWKLYAACAQWLRSADRVPRIILIEAGSCSPRRSIGSTWPVPLCWTVQRMHGSLGQSVAATKNWQCERPAGEDCGRMNALKIAVFGSERVAWLVTML
jgi:hypothetical protein